VDAYFAAHDPGYPYYTFNGVDFKDPSNNIGANGGKYNRAGRGTPDVSANGAKLQYYMNGGLAENYGTSLSAPIWASVITLLNEKRAEYGKGPVGFINPVLYEHPEVFHDITQGHNPGCGTDGFEAVEGWDPVTGLGTPNYPKLLELFLKLP
jgi:tripeptidyl-peptidase-1